MSHPPRITALIVAAGRGARAGRNGPKQYHPLASGTVLSKAAWALSGHPAIQDTLVVIHPDDRLLYEAAVRDVPKLRTPAMGGATRQDSVRHGLEALADDAPDCVLIHDAARPFVDTATIDRVIAALNQHAAVLAAVPLADTLKRQASDGCVAETLDRTGLWRAQTPQGFHFSKILAAHRAALSAGKADFTDDAALAEWAGMPVAIVAGAESNRKLTTPEDMAIAAREASSVSLIAPDSHDYRMATGFDVHRFTTGDHVWLCGLRIPHTASLEGHSDADVGLHALTDALLGAISDGDIGQHFPPSDPQWRGAASDQFLADAARRVRRRGGTIVHCDVTLLCEAPRITPHRDAMRARIADILAIAIDAVSVKATTTEGLGFTGRREGIAAQAAATVRLPRAMP